MASRHPLYGFTVTDSARPAVSTWMNVAVVRAVTQISKISRLSILNKISVFSFFQRLKQSVLFLLRLNDYFKRTLNHPIKQGIRAYELVNPSVLAHNDAATFLVNPSCTGKRKDS